MKKQKIQMLVVVILLVICVVAYIFISKNAGKLDSTENDGPNASMGNVTESVWKQRQNLSRLQKQQKNNYFLCVSLYRNV